MAIRYNGNTMGVVTIEQQRRDEEITKNYIITDKGRKYGYTIDGIIREVDHIVCASEYDYYGQVHLYANSYFKDNCRVGVSISGKESVIDNFVKYCIEREYLKEDKKC